MAYLLVMGCGGESPSPVEAPGADTSAKTGALESGAALLQRKDPLQALDVYLDGFHFYNGDMQRQTEAHHYCNVVNEDVTQCVIYDGNTRNGKLMGIEYIISARLFQALPAEEKHLWHSHVHEVRSGQLIAPGIPKVAEQALMKKIAGTYGKTWHTWNTDRDQKLPLGVPALMMGFTEDGQVNEQMVARRDERFNVSSARNRQSRSGIEYPPIDPDADAWRKGVTLQLQAVRRPDESP